MIGHRCRRVLAGVALAVVCGALISAPTAVAAPLVPDCVSSSPVHDVYLTKAMQTAVLAADGAAVGLYDRTTNTTCYHQPDQKFNTASVVKVLIATAAQWRAQQQNRQLTPEEDQLVRRMITSPVDQESNDAANLLWSDLRLHGPYVNVVIALLELTNTDPADDGSWGMTETTARDQVRLMTFLTSPGEEFLARERREYVLQRMTEVPPRHRFGVPVLAPAPWHNKIGYSKLTDDDSWETYFNFRTHSVGAVRGLGDTGEFDYVLVILSDRNFWARGIVRVSAAAAVINEAQRHMPR